MKNFYRMDGIGTAKYTINAHDGVSTHKDGSPFYGIRIFKSLKSLNKHIHQLITEGYVPL